MADQDIVAQIQAEYDGMARRMRENMSLMEQSQVEVDRLQQRNISASAQLRRIQESFDTVPRQDIKVAYEDAMDAKTRLLTMRSQLEKMQDTQAQLEHYQDMLKRLLEHLHDLKLPSQASTGKGGTSAIGKPTLGLAGETIIRIVQAQEQERQQLANSLHDGPAQSLTNFILQAEVCQRLFIRDPERANGELDQLKSAASTTFQKIRDFIFDLRPMMLDDLGLVPTLRRYAENFEGKSDVKITFNVAGEEKRRLPKHTEVMMFRTIQNLLAISANSLKARNIKLMVDVDKDEVRAMLEDDGQGFDPIVDLDPEHGDSDVQAINALRERLELVQGRLEVFSNPGENSRFDVRLPVLEDIGV
jgi:two-component system, NarL family, sensor histidine kinase DegS